MCNIIVINRGEKEITTPQQFIDHFGKILLKKAHYNSITMDACLCQIDIAEIFKKNKIEYKKDCGDFFVGQLDQVKGDND